MQHLESKGYKCVAVSLPSTQNTDTPPAGLADDTAAVRSVVLDELDTEKQDVVVLAHSYGGVPANNALYELDKTTRSGSGHTTSVKAVTFMCALPVPKGCTVGGFMTSRGGDGSAQAKSAIEMDSTGTFGLPKGSPGPEEALFNDLPSEEATRWARMLRPVSIRVTGEETTYAAYVDMPAGYLYCSIDESLPLVAQEFVVAEAKKAGAKIVLEQTVDAGHSPFLSQIEQTASFVLKVVELTR